MDGRLLKTLSLIAVLTMAIVGVSMAFAADNADADVDEGVKILQLLLEVHGVHQGLVAVPQVHGAPDGGLGDDLVGPGAAHDLLGLEGDILFVAWIHGSFLLNESIFTVKGCF